ncbi:krueppel target at 95d isoform a [Anaeramoeba ignava]|uniref:Krueppel target at 95d isoform a n=1 Tax=Anaeramoeba ignava TaxID=1746090 RepID=A0A9Q0LEL2_ANAIG|nr:krueppel target at 95d isoform a [Anaeramoeba ignava]
MNSEEQKVGIETKLFSGIKKGDIKDIPAHCVPRTCIAKITLLEIFLNEEFDFPSPLELSLSIDSGKSKLSTGAIHIPIKQEEENESKNQKQNKNTKTTIQTMKQQRKSTPITITPSKNDKKNISNKLESSNLILPFTENDSQLIYQLAYVFSFRYLHNLKYSDNILNIHLQRTKKRGKKKSTIGIGKINLADVLQMTFDSSLKLIEPNTNNLRAKINIRVVTIPLKIGALLNIQNEEVNDIDGEDFEEKDKHSSDSDDLQYLIEGPELTQIEPKQKKKRFGKLRNKLKFGARFRKGIKKKGGKQENEIISIQNQNQNQNQSNNDLNQMIKEEDSSDKEIINLTKILNKKNKEMNQLKK